MLATRIRQKDGVFYFVSYRVQDLLSRVRFTSRFYHEGEVVGGAKPRVSDDIAQFIAKVERSDKAFQRTLSRHKVASIVNFYDTAQTQPVMPAPVLLYTSETLRFTPLRDMESVGNLADPDRPFLIIDGQHRLAGLHFYRTHHPKEADRIEVPAVVFDGRNEDFAAEMFVVINSTMTRISKSHLVDLYERITTAEPDRKLAARIVISLYAEDDSPLQYKINRLGGRARQEKWILQSELFNEVHKIVKAHQRLISSRFGMDARRFYPFVRDFFKAVRARAGDVWGDNAKHAFTRDVTLKALVRFLDDLMSRADVLDGWRDGAGPEAFARPLARLAEVDLHREFRQDGFYERFPAKGQLERVRRVHEWLRDATGVRPPAD